MEVMLETSHRDPELRSREEQEENSLRKFLITSEVLDRYLYGKRAVDLVDVATERTERKRKSSEVGNEYSRKIKSIWCEECCKHVQGGCGTHSSSRRHTYAVDSFPTEVQLCTSSIPGYKYGACAGKLIPRGTWIGPYEGKLVHSKNIAQHEDNSDYWEIYRNGQISHFLDGSDEASSSWMRFIRCARHKNEQNMAAFQYGENIYYRAMHNIGIGDEILVWYDQTYAQFWGVPLALNHEIKVRPKGAVKDPPFVAQHSTLPDAVCRPHKVSKRPSSPLTPSRFTPAQKSPQLVPRVMVSSQSTKQVPPFTQTMASSQPIKQQQPFTQTVAPPQSTKKFTQTMAPPQPTKQQPPFTQTMASSQPIKQQPPFTQTMAPPQPTKKFTQTMAPSQPTKQQPPFTQTMAPSQPIKQEPQFTQIVALSQPTKQEPPFTQTMAPSQPTKQKPPFTQIVALSQPTKQEPPFTLTMAPSQPTNKLPPFTPYQPQYQVARSFQVPPLQSPSSIVTAPYEIPKQPQLPPFSMLSQPTTGTPPVFQGIRGPPVTYTPRPHQEYQNMPHSTTPGFAAAGELHRPDVYQKELVSPMNYPTTATLTTSYQWSPTEVKENMPLSSWQTNKEEFQLKTPNNSQQLKSSPLQCLSASLNTTSPPMTLASEAKDHNQVTSTVEATGDEQDSWKCGQCAKTFSQRLILQMHVCSRAPERPYQCGRCPLSFADPMKLREHVITHSNDRPFKCGFCGRSFAGATTLNNHMRMHTGEKPFSCDKCGKTFAIGTQLSRHMKQPEECRINMKDMQWNNQTMEIAVE